MKKALLALGLLWSAVANAQFTPGQLLTAGELNAQFALYAPLAGATFTGPVIATAFTGTPISGSTGSFTTLAASGAVSGVGFTNLFASPPSIGNTVAGTGAFTTLSASGAVSGTGFTNLFAAPPSIGNTTPGTGAFTTLSATSSFTATGLVTLADLATQAANTVLANATSGTASPTAFAMPSCSTSSSALDWTTSTGFTCNTAINASALGGVASASYALLASPTFTGTPAAPTAAATTNTTQIATTAMVNSAITGGSLAGSFTTVTPSQTGGIIGTTTNNNVSAGGVGEYPAANTSSTSMTNATAANCTAVSLSAGDWDVRGVVTFVPAATTTVSNILAGISTTSATLPTANAGANQQIQASFVTGGVQSLASSTVRVSLASAGTAYLIGYASFGVSTMTCNGFISARRVR